MPNSTLLWGAVLLIAVMAGGIHWWDRRGNQCCQKAQHANLWELLCTHYQERRRPVNKKRIALPCALFLLVWTAYYYAAWQAGGIPAILAILVFQFLLGGISLFLFLVW